jgi:hypothetical protein
LCWRTASEGDPYKGKKREEGELVGADGVAIGFVHQAHGFHEETGSAAGGGAAVGSVGGVEIDFEFAVGPEEHFVDGVVAVEVADFGVAALAVGEEEFALFSTLLDDQAAGFLAHFEGLHKVNHAHLFEAALDDARARGALLKFFEVQAINDFFCRADKIFQQKRLGDEILHAVDERAKAFFNIGTAGHEEKRNVTGGIAAAEFFEKLAAIEAGHLEIAEDDVRKVVDDAEERVGAIGADHDFTERVEALGYQIADERVVVGEKKLDGFAGGGGAHEQAPRDFLEAARRNSPDFPPVLRRR